MTTAPKLNSLSDVPAAVETSAGHDAWFRREVDQAVAEADSSGAEWDSQDQVKSQSAVKRAEWLSQARASEKATA